MKIALTTPSNWPRVRRGGERLVNELAAYLASEGHEVTVLSGKPGRGEVTTSRGYTTVSYRRLWHPALEKIGLLEFHAFFLNLFPALLRRRFDVVHSFTFIDAYAACLARAVTGVPCVFHVYAIPPPIQYFRSLTLKGAVLRRAMRDADEVIGLSDYVCAYLEKRFDRPGVRIPAPVDLTRFPLVSTRDHSRPVIFCAASLDDERKGGKLLMRAFNLVKRARPDARLRLSGTTGGRARSTLMDLVSPHFRHDVEFVGVGDLDAVPGLFASASVSVLPSRWEAFGMVLVESMATGTPVVGTRDGAIPEIINSDAVGRLFDPGDSGVEPSNVEGLAQAILETLELARLPETPHLCRTSAERFSWDVAGPEFLKIYGRLIAHSGVRKETCASVP